MCALCFLLYFLREREIVLVVAHTESVLMGVDDGVSARVER